MTRFCRLLEEIEVVEIKYILRKDEYRNWCSCYSLDRFQQYIFDRDSWTQKKEYKMSFWDCRQHSYGVTGQHNTPKKRLTEPARVRIMTSSS
ncbi:hypothetical protein BDA96_03G357500 [Sorghum bicolor]|uniref:Uncharacterized protein n=1 Tax=Sorghum bicolor TaxID=4558 RepID=A0A921RIR4_SORBI|nr:hypothetical protein BDA96_03G357500 [Sorghum bicolor]